MRIPIRGNGPSCRRPFGRGALRAALLGLALILSGPVVRLSAAPADVTVTTQPITAFDPSDPTRTRFGALVFLGGLVISSPDPAVAGISGMEISPDGRDFLAVSDFGGWVGGRIRADPDGRPQGLERVRVAPLLGADGRPPSGKIQGDAEALARRPSGGAGADYVVAIEAGARLLVYPGPDPMARRATVRPLPPAVRKLPSNNRIEALATIPSGRFAGRLLAFAEGDDRTPEAAAGWILGDRSADALRIARSDGFSITDAAFLPDGDLLVLERRFGLLSWFSARLRRIPGAAIRPGATLDGPVLWEAGPAYEIDNMEALAVHTGEDGVPVLTMMSDNNGMTRLQRTLLLRFRLAPSPDFN